jgi:glycosyltransferase involved in cell wall biosynthesis
MSAHPRARDKLHVLTLLDGLWAGGGAESLAREVLVRLDPARFDRTLCVSRWPEGAAATPEAQAPIAALRDAGVELLGLDRKSPLQLWAWAPLLSALRHGGVDILHSHKFGSNVWASILGTVARTPVVIAHEHTWSFEGRPVRRFLDRRLIASRADAFVAVSREDRRRMIEIEGIDPAKVVILPNGIPTPPGPTGKDARADLGIPAGAPLVGTVCTLRAQKALDVLLDATALLVRSVPEARVVIVGDGSQQGKLERHIARLGLAGVVTMAGYRPDIPDLLDAFDVAVCSSDFEGTPLSILEYLEAGLPVVSTRVGGIPDVIDDGVQGLLVPRRDPEALASALGSLLTDPLRAAEMGARGRERRRAEFDIARTVERTERLYLALHEAGGRLAQVGDELLSESGVIR